MTGANSTRSVAGALADMAAGVVGGDLPIRVRAWDGSEAGPAAGPVLVLRNRRALRGLIRSPGGPGFTAGYVAGDIDIEGDLAEALSRLWAVADSGPDPGSRIGVARWLGLSARLGIPGRRPPARSATGVPPAAPQPGDPTSRDALPTAFFELVLGPSLTSSSGYFVNGSADGLAAAQQANLDLICRKLALSRGTRHLDLQCGWGSLICHAAEHHGARSTGLTSSRQQYDYVTRRVAAAGLTDRVQVRLAGHRDLEAGTDDGRFDAVSAIEVGTPVGDAEYPAFAGVLHRVLRPGGRALVQQLSSGDRPFSGGAFVATCSAPDLQRRPPGTTVSLLGAAGLHLHDVRPLGVHYGRTLRAWAEALERSWNGAVDLIGDVEARRWRLHLVGGALAFAEHRLGVEQLLAVRPSA